MQPNIPLRQDNHPTFLRVENGQVGEDLPLGCCRNSRLRSLLVALVTRKDFPPASPETYDPIVGKSREKMEPLSLTLPFLCFFFLWITLNRTLKKEEASSLFPTCHTSFPFFSFLFLYLFLYLGPSISPLFFI